MNELLLLATAAASNPADLKIWAYVAFIGLVLVFLALDLGVFHREAHEVSMKEAVTWSVIWLTCGIAFSGFVYMAYENHWLGLGLDTPSTARGGDQGRRAAHRVGRGAGAGGGQAVPRGVRGREVAGDGQHLCHRADLLVLCGAAEVPAPRALLGHHRRAGDARRDDLPRRWNSS
jgi:hypothetical protein